MKRHILQLTRITARPAPALDAAGVAKYLNQMLTLTNSFLGTAERWQALQSGKEATQS